MTDLLIGLAPLALLLLVVAVIIARGMRSKPDKGNNKSGPSEDTRYYGPD